jgi:hypothetical protein
MRNLASILFAVALSACGPKTPQVDTADPMPPEETVADAGVDPDAEVEAFSPVLEHIEVSIVSADLKGRTASGAQWDDGKGKLSRAVHKPMLAYLQQHPELLNTAGFVGIPVDNPELAKEAQRDTGIDPMVFIEVGDHMFRTPARVGSFNPLWDYPFTFLFGHGEKRRGVLAGSLVRIHVADFDNSGQFDAAGTKLFTVDELIAKPIHQIGPFGSVKSITLQVKRSPAKEEAERTTYRFAIPGKPSWTDTGVDIVAGAKVLIEAADEVCTKGENLSSCSGPEGQSKASEANLKGFEKVGHGALVGSLGDTRFTVQRRLEFTAPSSGSLRLGVNDKDVGNNSGSYEVRITVTR